ncbi:hypothetical protein S245_040451, partial [Arachis hypogaea]
IDETKREQMTLVRFVDKHRFVKERLIDVIHVKNTTSTTLKQEICFVLSHHNLNSQNLKKLLIFMLFLQIATNQIEIGRRANEIGTLKRATTSVLEDLATNSSTYSQRGDATYALKSLLSFDFVFSLHMMKEIMGITYKLCQGLQQKSQDILNAMLL